MEKILELFQGDLQLSAGTIRGGGGGNLGFHRLDALKNERNFRLNLLEYLGHLIVSLQPVIAVSSVLFFVILIRQLANS